MNSLKITDFFETDLFHNFYYINDKDMSLCSLDSCHHTQLIIVKKKRKALQISMYFKLYLNALVKNYRLFLN